MVLVACERVNETKKYLTMKTKSYILLSSMILLLMCSFSMDNGYYTGWGDTPILMERAVFEGAVQTMPARELEKTSRISLLGNLIYIVELHRGVHVIDNTDPKNPNVDFHFINIPGCVDMSIKDTIMYARSAEDLVAIDISNISDVKVMSRVRETFPELKSDEWAYGVATRFQKGNRPENTVIVGWEENESNLNE